MSDPREPAFREALREYQRGGDVQLMLEFAVRCIADGNGNYDDVFAVGGDVMVIQIAASVLDYRHRRDALAKAEPTEQGRQDDAAN